jgi:protein-disulfide isomerase
VEEYSSFGCGHCRDFFIESEGRLIQDYVATGVVYFVYKPYHSYGPPLPNQAYHAAFCAGEQGAFWEMHDLLFANFGTFAVSSLTNMAERLELDMGPFNSCMRSEKYYDQVIEETQTVATELEISGTPTFVINGEVAIIGNEGYEALAQAIDAALEAAQND